MAIAMMLAWNLESSEGVDKGGRPSWSRVMLVFAAVLTVCASWSSPVPRIDCSMAVYLPGSSLPLWTARFLAAKRDLNRGDLLGAAFAAFHAGHAGPDDIAVGEFGDEAALQKSDDFVGLEFEEFVGLAAAGAFSALVTVVAGVLLEAFEAVVDLRADVGLRLPHRGQVSNGHRCCFSPTCLILTIVNIYSLCALALWCLSRVRI